MWSNAGDPEVLLIIPFTSQVKIKSLVIISENENSAPQTMKLFVNIENVDFGNVDELVPVQELMTGPNLDGSWEYAVK